MDPITLIVTALAAGAALGVKDTASAMVKDAYAGLKALVKKRLGDGPSAELEEPWRHFAEFLENPGFASGEEIQGADGVEPSEGSQSSHGETRLDRNTDLPPAAPAVLTDQIIGVEAAAPASSAGSEFWCCQLTAAGYSTVRATFDTSVVHAWVKCKTRQQQLAPPHRTMTLSRGRC